MGDRRTAFGLPVAEVPAKREDAARTRHRAAAAEGSRFAGREARRGRDRRQGRFDALRAVFDVVAPLLLQVVAAGADRLVEQGAGRAAERRAKVVARVAALVAFLESFFVKPTGWRQRVRDRLIRLMAEAAQRVVDVPVAGSVGILGDAAARDVAGRVADVRVDLMFWFREAVVGAVLLVEALGSPRVEAAPGMGRQDDVVLGGQGLGQAFGGHHGFDLVFELFVVDAGGVRFAVEAGVGRAGAARREGVGVGGGPDEGVAVGGMGWGAIRVLRADRVDVAR